MKPASFHFSRVTGQLLQFSLKLSLAFSQIIKTVKQRSTRGHYYFYYWSSQIELLFDKICGVLRIIQTFYLGKRLQQILCAKLKLITFFKPIWRKLFSRHFWSPLAPSYLDFAMKLCIKLKTNCLQTHSKSDQQSQIRTDLKFLTNSNQNFLQTQFEGL
jgi:hypothetical protein